MTDLLNNNHKYSRMFICWWITTIVTIFIPFISAFMGNETLFYIVIIQIILAVISIVSLTIIGAKKTSVVRDIAVLVSSQSGEVYQNLINLGISEREARAYRNRFAPVAALKPVSKAPAYFFCPNCGSENVTKARSDLEEFFWIIVLFGSTSSITPFAVIGFGICVVLSIIAAILNKLAGVTVKRLKCRSCGRKFEYRSDGR